MASDAPPPFVVSESWREFVARWQPALEDIGEGTSMQEAVRILGGAILDLGWQASTNRHEIRQTMAVLTNLQSEMFGLVTPDGKRTGGAFGQMEAHILQTLEEQEATRRARRRESRRWWMGWAVATGALALAALEALRQLV